MKVKEITDAIEAMAPLHLQESWDNAGMQVGNPKQEVTGVLLCTDVREETVDEAIERGFNVIISHHPLLFHKLSLHRSALSYHIRREPMQLPVLSAHNAEAAPA